MELAKKTRSWGVMCSLRVGDSTSSYVGPMKITIHCFRQIMTATILVLLSYSLGDAGLFSDDIEVQFNVKMPSEKNLSTIKRIAVVNIENDQNNRITNTLGTYLQGTGAFEILERAQLQKLMQEHNLSVSGTVLESSATQIGQILGVEALIYGSVNTFKVYDETTEKKITIKTGTVTKYDKKGKAYDEDVYGDVMAPAVVRHGDIDLILKVSKVETGIIRAQKNFTAVFEETQINHIQAKQIELPSNGEVEKALINSALTKFVHYTTPYTVPISVKWDDEWEDKEAEQLIKASMFDEAQAAMEANLQKALENAAKREKLKGGDKGLAAIYYNLGLLAERKSEVDKAQEYYKKAQLSCFKKPQKHIAAASERIKSLSAAWQAYNNELAGN